MRNIIIVLAATAALVGCSRSDRTIRESAGAQKDQIEQSKDAQKEALNDQKKQADERADAEKAAAEARKDAEQSQIDAQQKQIDAEAKAEKAQVEANKEVSEAAGAAADKQNSDSAIEARVREAILGTTDQAAQSTSTATKDVKVSVRNGVVTLRGNVPTASAKADVEAKAKGVQGVTSVENKLEIKAD
jgi:hyperosmotically inducible periplasmic protein